MDEKKKGFPESQQNDGHWAIKLFQEIRQELLVEGSDDCAARVIFRGVDDVPTTVAFIGDMEARMDVYQSYSYRGPLIRFKGYKNDPMQTDKDGRTRNLYTTLKDECDFLLAQAQLESERSNLWNYQVPNPLLNLRK